MIQRKKIIRRLISDSGIVFPWDPWNRTSYKEWWIGELGTESLEKFLNRVTRNVNILEYISPLTGNNMKYFNIWRKIWEHLNKQFSTFLLIRFGSNINFSFDKLFAQLGQDTTEAHLSRRDLPSQPFNVSLLSLLKTLNLETPISNFSLLGRKVKMSILQ